MADATGYVVNATAANRHTASCSSTIAACTLTDLLCSETYTATITAQGSQCDSPPGSSTIITTGEFVQRCDRTLSACVKKNFLLFPSGKPHIYILFLLLSFQPPVLQLSYLSSTHVAPTQQSSLGLTLREASASWLR